MHVLVRVQAPQFYGVIRSGADRLCPLTAAVQKLTFVENVMRRTPDADVGRRKKGDVMIPLYPE